MTSKKTPYARVKRQRSVYTYAELWHASGCVLRAGCREPVGSSYQFLSSLVLTAFAFEAFLNHVGERSLNTWKEIERSSPISKLRLLSEVLGMRPFPWSAGRRPFATLQDLFKFRNQIAHGRSVVLSSPSEEASVNDVDGLLGVRLDTPWEKLVRNDDFAARAREDVWAIMERLHRARRDDKEALLSFGISEGGASLISE